MLNLKNKDFWTFGDAVVLKKTANATRVRDIANLRLGENDNTLPKVAQMLLSFDEYLDTKNLRYHLILS